MTRWAALCLVCLMLGPRAAAAQDAGAAVPTASRADAAPEPWKPPHRFWDAGNVALAATVAASRALDYDSTGHFRKRGDNEWLLTNRIVDNKPLFAAIEIAGGAATIGMAYWLHREGHHTLERWVMVLHSAVTTGGAIHNYSLDPPR